MNPLFSILSVLLVLLGCSKGAVELPKENQVVHECYHPFFDAAESGDPERMKSVLSEATIRYNEEVFFVGDKAPVQTWEEFTLAYRSMKVSRFVNSAEVTGNRALIKDAVGGTLRCVREKGVWKVDLTPTP
jgi:hypothetical protein